MSDNALESPATPRLLPFRSESDPSIGALPSREDRARSKGYRSRFVWVYVALAALAGVGLAAFVVLLAKPDAAPAAKWSAWSPTGSDDAKARQVAAHVATTIDSRTASSS